MIVLAGGDLVLPDGILARASLVIDGARIAAVEPKARVDPAGASIVAIDDCYVVPGFIDVHVHGVEGYDTLDPGDPVAEMAARLPRYGVTAFCPTTVACGPEALRSVLAHVARARSGPCRTVRASCRPTSRATSSIPITAERSRPSASVPERRVRFAEPALRTDIGFRRRDADECVGRVPRSGPGERNRRLFRDRHPRRDCRCAVDVGIVTLAPELPGGIELVRTLVSAGHRVSLGHSGATIDEAMAAIELGARQATHLFNGMAPMTHRSPGVAGAVLARDEVAAELICDGYHVHPAMSRMAIDRRGSGGSWRSPTARRVLA